MDGDNDLDIITVSSGTNKISLLKNDGNQNFTEQIVHNASMAAKSAKAYDIDNDNDIDIISASGNDDKVAVHYNDGSMGFTEQIICSDCDNAYSCFVADLNNDGLGDIISASMNGDMVKWHEQNGTGTSLIENKDESFLIIKNNGLYLINTDQQNDNAILKVYSYNGQLIYSNNNYINASPIELRSGGPFVFKLILRNGIEHTLMR